MLSLRPPEIVRELDRHLAGQERAKRALAIAIRNRWRHQQAGELHDSDLASYRYLVGGPKGSGKSRLVESAATIVAAPFVRIHLLQLAAADSPERAVAHVLGDLVDAAIEREPGGTLEHAIHAAEESGIILIDGIDRWIQPGDDVSADPLEAAQQALIGLAAATYSETRNGRIRTRHILMFAAGGVLAGRPSETPFDLHMLFPRRIDLEPLDERELLQILEDPNRSPLGDYAALLKTEGIDVLFTPGGIEAIAAEAIDQNRRIEDIGARRLAAIAEIVLDDLLYCDVEGSPQSITIDAAYVAERLGGEGDDEDLEDFIL